MFSDRAGFSSSQHPFGVRARVLLTSVFGPFAQDDKYGGRAINPMELYHNQVTRFQRAFSLRMFHRSWGLMLIQANISAPCTVLDFPTLERFLEELEREPYDIIGIGSIIPNAGKVKKMCELIRLRQPAAVIVVGGHVANLPSLEQRIDADHIVKGEGVRWFRSYLGEPVDRPIAHLRVPSCFGTRTMGTVLSEKPGTVAAALIPSVGCPIGCNFCSTSAMFGGKGSFVNFYHSGEELFRVMLDLEREMKAQAFFVMDENFLLHRRRALELLELMKRFHKPWSLYIFSSANVLRSYRLEQLVGLGISWVWMGLEGKNTAYAKLKGVDTLELVRELQAHGIRVLGSSIIGLEDHTPENIDAVIEHAVSHETEFHQFMLYTPLPGTALFEEHKAGNTLLDPDCVETSDLHGQLKFVHRHPHIPMGLEAEYLHRAFLWDFEVNGPSVARMARTLLQGWKRYRRHPDPRIRARFRWETRELPTLYAGALWACKRWFAHQPALRAKIGAVLKEVYRTFGLKARFAAPFIGRIILSRIRREDRRLQAGVTYEPTTFYEKMRQPQR